MQGKRPGESEELRLGRNRSAREAEGSVGAKRGVFHTLPEIGDYGGQLVLSRPVSVVETVRGRRVMGHAGQDRGCVDAA